MMSRAITMPRNPVSLLTLACCAFLALVACEHQPMPGVDPTPASAPQAPPPPSTTVDTTTTTTTITATESTTATGQEVITVDETQTQTQTQQPAVSSAQREADIADCYAFAWSQVQRDVEVQNDRDSVVDSTTVNPGFTDFTQKLDAYGNEKRRGELFDKCMVAKGYAEDGY